MITENIVLESDLKNKLKHLSIDEGIYVSTMLVSGAEDILEEGYGVRQTISESYDPFTMKIEDSLKTEIKKFCSDRKIRIKDFWNEAAYIAIQKYGE